MVSATIIFTFKLSFWFKQARTFHIPYPSSCQNKQQCLGYTAEAKSFIKSSYYGAHSGKCHHSKKVTKQTGATQKLQFLK